MTPDHGQVVNDTQYEAFARWLEQHHFPTTKLTLAHFENTGRGMMATSDIKAGEVIVSVPKAFLITNESLTQLYGTHSFGAQQLLALHLVILSQEQDSWWKPYLDLLPKHFNTMPVTYPASLFNLLPVSLQEQVAQQKETIRRDYKAAVDFLLAQKRAVTISFEAYQWAWLCVNTRCIHLSAKGAPIKADNIAMAPMLDFLNHSWDAKIESGYNITSQSFEIRTQMPYKKGEQVFINYGPHDNFAILKEYGFVVPDNGFNYVQVDKEVWDLFDDLDSTKSVIAKKEYLTKAGYYGDYSIKMGEPSFRLLNALRLLALEGPQSPRFEHRLWEWDDVVMGKAEQISNDNERRVSIMLQDLCERVQKRALERIATLEDFMAQQKTIEPKGTVHPFALVFVQQVWQETADIASATLDSARTQI